MDIREILKALDEKDRRLWSECRTAMRKVYLTAHNKVLGLSDYEAQDDAFMDLIDIKLALLFDRGGRVNATKPLIGEDAEKIEEDLINKSEIFKNYANNCLKPLLDESVTIAKPQLAITVPMNEWK